MSECENCKEREVKQLREDLQKCKKNNQTKDKKLKEQNKKVFILTIIGVAIAAIFGKEVLDMITEWMGSVDGFRSTVLQGLILPAPSTLSLYCLAFVCGGRRKRID